MSKVDDILRKWPNPADWEERLMDLEALAREQEQRLALIADIASASITANNLRDIERLARGK